LVPALSEQQRKIFKFLLKYGICSDKMFGMHSGTAKTSRLVDLRADLMPMPIAAAIAERCLAIFAPGRKKSKIWDILRHFGAFAALLNTVFSVIPGLAVNLALSRRSGVGHRRDFLLYCSTAPLSTSPAKPPPRGELRHCETFRDLYLKIAP
jgi:hypothetical protein